MTPEAPPPEPTSDFPEHFRDSFLDVASPAPELALWWVGLQIKDAELRNASEEERGYLQLGKALIEVEFIERENDRGATRNRLKGLMRHRRKIHNLLNQPRPDVYVYKLANEARWALSGRNPTDYSPEDRKGIEDAWSDASVAEKDRRKAETDREDYIRDAESLLNNE